jgi:hypothetical protein
MRTENQMKLPLDSILILSMNKSSPCAIDHSSLIANLKDDSECHKSQIFKHSLIFNINIHSKESVIVIGILGSSFYNSFFISPFI